MGVGTSSIFGGIGYDALVTNILVEAGIEFGHRVSSLVIGAVDVVMVAALGCCTIGGIAVIGGEWAFFLLELSCGFGDFLDFALGQVVYHHRHWARFGSRGCWLHH